MRSSWRFAFLALAAGCASAPRPRAATKPDTPAARTALRSAAEAFYTAETPGALREAVARARSALPQSAVRFELEGALGQLEVRGPEHAHRSAYAAVLAQPAQASHRRLRALLARSDTLEARQRTRALLETVSGEAEAPSVRARAARAAARLAWVDGEPERARALEARVRAGLRWRILGAFDNDQGKGFDEALPPERTIDLDARYEGAIVEIGWRTPSPRPVGPALDLQGSMSPSRWALAYATSTFATRSGGPHELRVTTTDPIKIWLNGQLVLSQRVVTRADFDQLVIPVELAPGRHRLLVKSAQTTGAWQVGVRITGPGGAPAPIEPLSPSAAPTGGSRALGPTTGAEVLEGWIEAREGEDGRTARDLVLAFREAEARGLRSEALDLSDRLLARFPRSIVARHVRASATWDHGERGQASDLLERLADEHGDALPYFHLQVGRFARQEGLQRKARAALERAEPRVPPEGRASLHLRWARQLAEEGWTEDRCRRLERLLEARPGRLRAMVHLADCRRALDFRDDARDGYLRVVDAAPRYVPVLRRLQRLALDAGRLGRARRWAEALRRAVPHRAWPHLLLAEVDRREKRFAAARARLEAARALDPDASAPWRRLGQVEYQAGRREAAVAAWRESLARNPEDERLAHRLAFLAPEEEGVWAEDIPDAAAIEAALAARVEPAPGAHVVNLLDHEVTLLKPDGSTTSVVTLVMRALDDAGRDQLTKVALRRGGRLRVRSAYAVAPGGSRAQVSSVRDRQARFRSLEVGSAVVLQFRHDVQPVGYLSRHMARGWWFQSPNRQTVKSEWVLWRPEGATLHEWVNDPDGEVTRTAREEGGLERVAWSAESIRPLATEPNMPTAREVALNMLVSTVPDWSTFLEWEKALLTDAFRDDARIEALAEEVVGDATSPREKALRIHEWLMREIRYQQDYENHIAGVRPHPAPVVVERSYGDCKDKSVLFITLARQVGLEARFALLRTRPRGPLLREVPMQQFDHAIVYVPEQPGLESGFFVDSTADALDVGALRQDDMGVTALVVDPETETHAWREIPFRPPEENAQRLRTEVRLDASGAAEGRFELRTRGIGGSAIRRLARNERALEQAMQGVVARSYGGGVLRALEAVETDSLRAPARIALDIAVSSFARREGRQLRARVPPVFNPKALFQLETRERALVLGAPRTSEAVLRVRLGEGLRLRRLPPDVDVEAACFRFEREASAEAGEVTVRQRFVTLCERIEAGDYPDHRAKAEAMLRALDAELVLSARSASATRAEVTPPEPRP